MHKNFIQKETESLLECSSNASSSNLNSPALRRYKKNLSSKSSSIHNIQNFIVNDDNESVLKNKNNRNSCYELDILNKGIDNYFNNIRVNNVIDSIIFTKNNYINISKKKEYINIHEIIKQKKYQFLCSNLEKFLDNNILFNSNNKLTSHAITQICTTHKLYILLKTENHSKKYLIANHENQFSNILVLAGINENKKQYDEKINNIYYAYISIIDRYLANTIYDLNSIINQLNQNRCINLDENTEDDILNKLDEIKNKKITIINIVNEIDLILNYVYYESQNNKNSKLKSHNESTKYIEINKIYEEIEKSIYLNTVFIELFNSYIDNISNFCKILGIEKKFIPMPRSNNFFKNFINRRQKIRITYELPKLRDKIEKIKDNAIKFMEKIFYKSYVRNELSIQVEYFCKNMFKEIK